MFNENLKEKILAVSISKVLLSSAVIVTSVGYSNISLADCSAVSATNPSSATLSAVSGTVDIANQSFSCVQVAGSAKGVHAMTGAEIKEEANPPARYPNAGYLADVITDSGDGIYVESAGKVNLERGADGSNYTSLNITATTGNGIFSTGAGSSVNIGKDTVIDAGANGLVAKDNGSITLTGIANIDADGIGLTSENSGSQITLTGKTDINAQSYALLVKDGGGVSIGNSTQVSTIKTKGTGDLISLVSASGTPGSLSFSNTELTSSANVINASGGVWDVSLDNNSVASGDVNIDVNTTLNMKVKGGSALTGKTTNAGTFDLELDSGVWNMTNDSSVSSLNILSGSRVNFATGNDKTLTAVGLSGNGTFQINTKFNSDGSAQTDLIHVTGDATGEHSLYVVSDSGSKGGQTTNDGIKLVQIDGTSSAKFGLVNQSGSAISYISMDAYDYYLHEGTSAGNSSDENDWFLRSTFNGGNNGIKPSSAPQYRQEVPGYIITPYANMMYGYQTVGTLHERMGDTQQFARGYDNKTWGRFGGNHTESKAGRFNYDFDTMFAQFGRDIYQSVTEEETNVTAGMTVTLGRQQTDAKDKGRQSTGQSKDTGSVTTNAYSVGAYYTRYANDGGYIDAVSQFTYYDNHYSSRYDADQKSYGLIVSLEGGKPFVVTENWKIEPQGQIVYQFLSADDFNDEISDVRGDNYNGGLARAGVRFFRDAAVDKENEVFKPYLTADVVGNLDDTPSVQVGSAKLRPDVDQFWWQTGVGVTANAAKNTSFYLDAKYMQSFEGDLNGYAVHAGVQGRF